MPQFTYQYDEQGHVTGVDVDGQTIELGAEDAMVIPPRQIRDMHDPSTSICSTRQTVEEIKDSFDADDKNIVVAVEATHGGYFNKNQYHYLTDGMKRAVGTWTTPYPKPYISNHNMRSDPMGRVTDASFVETDPMMGYHDLTTSIGDPKEIERVIDGRSLTVSVGSEPVDTVECSYCAHDLYHNGNAPERVEIEGTLPDDWLEQDAPGRFGRFMTNEDFWDFEETDAGKQYLVCRHVRGVEAPPNPAGDRETRGQDDKIGWYLHEQKYKELTRTNIPADQNEATGEFAHIREVLSQTDGLTDATRDKVLAETLSRRGEGRARHRIASENDLWRPPTAQEATDYVNRHGTDVIFDTGLWLATVKRTGGGLSDQVEAYQAQGGRFLKQPRKVVTAAEALDFENPRKFGQWLRQQDLERADFRALSSIYTRLHLRRRA